MTKQRLFAVLCSTFLTCLATGAAAADGDPKTLQQAQERLREGNRLYDKGDYAGARVAYEQSASLVPHGATYRNLGTTELKLGDDLAALKHLRLALSAPDLSADRKATTQRDLATAYAATGHLAVTANAGASLSVDGRAVEGTAPLADPIDVPIGKHTVEAHLGSASAKVDVDAKGGSVVTVELSVAPPAPPPPAPVAASEASPPAAQPITAMPEIPRLESSPPFWTTRRAIGVAVAGAGVLALGASAYVYADGLHQEDRASALAAGLPGGACATSSPPSACGALQNAHDAQSTDETWRLVFLGVGAAAVVVGAGLFFWPTAHDSHAAIVPVFGPQGGGLQLRGEL
jgi:hypothetical protein